MSTQPAVRRWTYDEFARLPDDGNRYEVIEGEIHATPGPTPLHQKIAARITVSLEGFTQAHGLGEVFPGPIDVLFGDGDYLEPDLVFVRADRLGIVSERGIEGPPDLVVEVPSSGTALRDRGIKRDRYAHFGVAEYWIADPASKQIVVHRSADTSPHVATDRLEWQPIPGRPTLALDVQELLRDIRPAHG